MNKLTPTTFDALVARGAPHAYVRESRIIWTASAIAKRIGRSEDYVRKTMAHEPGTPIKKRGRRLYVFEQELMAYLGEAA